MIFFNQNIILLKDTSFKKVAKEKKKKLENV